MHSGPCTSICALHAADQFLNALCLCLTRCTQQHTTIVPALHLTPHTTLSTSLPSTTRCTHRPHTALTTSLPSTTHCTQHLTSLDPSKLHLVPAINSTPRIRRFQQRIFTHTSIRSCCTLGHKATSQPALMPQLCAHPLQPLPSVS